MILVFQNKEFARQAGYGPLLKDEDDVNGSVPRSAYFHYIIAYKDDYGRYVMLKNRFDGKTYATAKEMKQYLKQTIQIHEG